VGCGHYLVRNFLTPCSIINKFKLASDQERLQKGKLKPFCFVLLIRIHIYIIWSDLMHIKTNFFFHLVLFGDKYIHHKIFFAFIFMTGFKT